MGVLVLRAQIVALREKERRALLGEVEVWCQRTSDEKEGHVVLTVRGRGGSFGSRGG
jgi:hypothetical protein